MMQWFTTGYASFKAYVNSLSCVVLSVWIVAVVDSTITTSESLDYLIQFGYLHNQDQSAGALRTKESFSQALVQFQRMAGIPLTGTLDNATKAMMAVPRCGNADNVEIGLGTRRRRYALQGSKWGKRELTFKISDFPRDMSPDMVEKEVFDAFKVWADVTPLKFVLRPHSEKVDVMVRFARRHHGDGNPFDGRGRTLAHAFFPQFGGDVHFDDDEDWTINMTSGVNMFQVAAHEFGHSLGLSHSDVSTAIMAPFYRGYQRHFRLDKDDILAVQEIYGPKGPIFNKAPSTRPPPRGPVLSIPKICMDPKIDAITMDSEGYTYIFKGTQYYRLNSYGIDDAYPREIQEDWKGITGPIDSALHWDNGYTYIFKGHFYWKFHNFKLIYVHRISEGFKGIPANIDAAFVWGGNGKTYFIKGDQYWRYTANHVDQGYPKSMAVWVGLPPRIDAALKWKNGLTYFFSGDLYYRYNDVDFNVDPSYPRNIASWWLGCPDKDQITGMSENLAGSNNQTNETTQAISQSQLEEQQVQHNEGDSNDDQFNPVITGEEAGTVDFFHDDDTSATTINSSHCRTITFMLFINIVILIFQQKS